MNDATVLLNPKRETYFAEYHDIQTGFEVQTWPGNR